MLGDGRLGDPELLLDDRADRAGGQLALGEQLEDPPAHRVAEHIERVHVPENIRIYLYKSTLILAPAGYGWPAPYAGALSWPAPILAAGQDPGLLPAVHLPAAAAAGQVDDRGVLVDADHRGTGGRARRGPGGQVRRPGPHPVEVRQDAQPRQHAEPGLGCRGPGDRTAGTQSVSAIAPAEHPASAAPDRQAASMAAQTRVPRKVRARNCGLPPDR